MPTISHLNHARALNNPEAEFETPRALADEVAMTRGEKIATLKRWADLVDRRLASGNEGMPVNGSEERDAELMREIGIVRAELEDPDAPPLH